ncbi:phosphate ABC transporter permease [Campylobacterota bacterium]|nr:phosphate ABC transporter permease [Campylobacterota bacterium]
MLFADRFTLYAARFGAAIVALTATLLFVSIALCAVQAVAADWGAVFSWRWQPSNGEFGILPMLVGSLILSAITTPIAFVIALLVTGYTLTSRSRFAAILSATLEIMSGIPTVLYAFVALFLLTPLLRAAFGGSGLSLFTAVIALVLLVLPTVALTLKAAIKPRLDRFALSALALGMSRMEAFFFLALKNAKTGLIAAAMLGFGRAIGDTLMPLMLGGNAAQTPMSLFDSFRSLSAHIALATANEAGAAAYDSLFAAGGLLLAITLGVSFAARILTAQSAK